jgi:TPR repeat protein
MIDINTLRSDAEKGIDDAIVELGIRYLTGKGIKKNSVEAVKLFKNAALKNNCEGMYNLSMCLLKGQGCSVNEVEAFEFLQKAAELKHIKSINFLENFYINNKDFEKALYYCKSASELGDSLYRFKMGLSATIEMSWNTYLPKEWEEFAELLSLLKAEIYKAPNAIMEQS